MKQKVKEWARRYIPAEIFGTVFAVLGAMLTIQLTHQPVVAAYVGTMSENLGYYGTILVRDFFESLRHHRARKLKYSMWSSLKVLRNFVVEFGVGELFDTILIRPFWMYTLPRLLHNFPLGVFLGKLAADITFYGPTIIAYEFRKKRWS